MKTKITVLVAVVALGLCSFKLSSDKVSASVQEVEGIGVFAYSKPQSKYDILGMVKVKGIVKSDDGPHMVELLVKNAKKDFPSGEAIIVGSDFEKAEVIRFKD
jgi:hypothetical protein